MTRRRRTGVGVAKRDRWVGEGLGCLAGALLLLGIAVATGEDTYWLRQRGEVVSAQVLGEKSDSSRQANKRIIVEYTTKAGEKVRGETSNYLEGKMGLTIDVVYDRENPQRMQAADWGLDYGEQIIVGGIGTLFLAAGATFLIGRHPN